MDRSRGFSSAHVLALAALVVALGGTAWALTRNEVKSKHIAPNAVRAGDERDLKWRPLAANADCDKAGIPSRRDPAAAIDNQGMVHLRGEWDDCDGPIVVVLPAKYRPSKEIWHPISIDFAPYVTAIETDGEVIPNGPVSGIHSLEGVSYSKR
jgi:hypothetical protein